MYSFCNRKNNDNARSYNVGILDDGEKLQSLRNCNTNERISGFPRTTKSIDKIDDIEKVHRILGDIMQDYFPSPKLSLLVMKDILRSYVGRPDRDAQWHLQERKPKINGDKLRRDLGMDYMERTGVHAKNLRGRG